MSKCEYGIDYFDDSQASIREESKDESAEIKEMNFMFENLQEIQNKNKLIIHQMRTGEILTPSSIPVERPE